jgi:hypothetical protein
MVLAEWKCMAHVSKTLTNMCGVVTSCKIFLVTTIVTQHEGRQVQIIIKMKGCVRRRGTAHLTRGHVKHTEVTDHPNFFLESPLYPMHRCKPVSILSVTFIYHVCLPQNEAPVCAPSLAAPRVAYYRVPRTEPEITWRRQTRRTTMTVDD